MMKFKNWLAGFGLTLALSFSATPATAASPTWCNAQRNFSPAEETVCRSQQLSLLDRRMSAAYSGARNANPAGRNEIKQVQRRWLERRNNCNSNHQCLVERYERQIDWLDGYGGHTVDPTPTYGNNDDANPWLTRGYQRCFNFVMSGRVNWGGGAQWRSENAAWLCEGAIDVTGNPPDAVYCFRRQRNSGHNWEDAIRLCRTNRGLVEGTARQTDANRRNGTPPQRINADDTYGNDSYDPAEENEGFDEPQYNAEGNEGVDHSEDFAESNPFCGWWAIYSCHRSRNRAIRDMNNNGYGGVVDTSDVPNFRNGYYCVADGPFRRKRRALKLRNRSRSDYQSVYVKNGCR